MLRRMPAKRGQIKYKARRQQIVDFSGLRFGNKTSTDIDGYLDFGDKASIFTELKLEGTPVERGQELAFERIVDDVSKSKAAIFIIADHAIYDAEQEIPAHTCLVRKYRYKYKWYSGSAQFPMVIDIVNHFLRQHGLSNEVQNMAIELDEDGNPIDDSWMENL